MSRKLLPCCFLVLCIATTLHAQHRAAVRSGPMVGYGEMTETMLWVQTTSTATVQYRYWQEGKKKEALLSKNVLANEETDFIAKVLLTNLKHQARYEYELLLNGKIFPRPYPLTFITQTFWQWRTEPPAFSVAFGSCAFINDSLNDRPGKPYGSSYNIFTSIAEKKTDLMLWLGDNTYYREPEYYSESGLRKRWAYDRALTELQPLLGATHHYMTWDDHDFGPDNSDRTYKLRNEALNVFKSYSANQTYGTLETAGVFQRFTWADAEFFMMDCRFYRSPNEMPDDVTKTMFGKEQLQWLKESLVSSEATFKIVVNGNQILAKHRDETLANFTTEYNELLSWLKQRKISGVLFLSGDRHLAELSCLRDSAFYPLYDFTSSPLTAGVSSSRKQEENSLSVAGTFVNDTRNFGLLKFDGPRTDRRVAMELYDSNGKLRWTHIVKASELMLPTKK